MSNPIRTLKSALAFAAMIACGSTVAAPVYVGSWEVDDGPPWPTVPVAYTGQEAAALLFGGLPSDYAISTLDELVANINNKAWVSTWGGACGPTFPCGTEVAENFEASTGGLYANVGDTSAYVLDWAQQTREFDYTNFAFRIDGVGVVPEPATLALLGLGLAGLGVMRRRKNV